MWRHAYPVLANRHLRRVPASGSWVAAAPGKRQYLLGCPARFLVLTALRVHYRAHRTPYPLMMQNDMPPEAANARETHELDQAVAALINGSRLALSVFRGAVESGSTPAEAVAVTASFWRALLDLNP